MANVAAKIENGFTFPANEQGVHKDADRTPWKAVVNRIPGPGSTGDFLQVMLVMPEAELIGFHMIN